MNKPELLIAINRAAAMRGVELEEMEQRGYLAVLGDESQAAVWDALAALWRDATTKAMPTPGEIRKEIARQAKAAYARRDLIEPPPMTDQERAEAQAHIDWWKRTSPLFGGNK